MPTLVRRVGPGRAAEGYGHRRRGRRGAVHNLGFRLFWLQDPALQRECFRVYNDWLAEYCSYAPERLKGLALVSLYDPKLAAEELERCAKKGLSGAMIWASPPEDQPYHLDMYDVFWSRAQELGMPLSLHPPTGMERPKYEFGRENRVLRPIIAAQEVQKSLAVIIASGVLERFPLSTSSLPSTASAGYPSGSARWTTRWGAARADEAVSRRLSA